MGQSESRVSLKCQQCMTFTQPPQQIFIEISIFRFFYNSVADQVKYANESQPKSTHKKAHTKAVLHKKKKVVNKSLYDTSAKIIKVTWFLEGLCLHCTHCIQGCENGYFRLQQGSNRLKSSHLNSVLNRIKTKHSTGEKSIFFR